MPSVLIIDDDISDCRFFGVLFRKLVPNIATAQTLAKGMQLLDSNGFDVVFLDVNLPDGNGLQAIPDIQAAPCCPEVIIMTGDGDPDGAELAMKLDVWDYIQKSESKEAFRLALKRALSYREQKLARQDGLPRPVQRAGIIGRSKAIRSCLAVVSRAASDDLPVLITGETGTGKELFARAIHENSSRRDGEFVVVDCAALPDHLVESTLFGHRRGAFTGADVNKPGLLEMADKGTLFLDELGELPLDIQKKFLRVLQEKKFRPVGSQREIASDFRLVAATNRDLFKMTQDHRFRLDLYYRIMSIKLELPRLKDRESDILLIAAHQIEMKNRSATQKATTMSEQFMEELEFYGWPGNVRELKNAVDLACSRAMHGEALFSKHLPEHIRTANIRNRMAQPQKDDPSPAFSGTVAPLKDYVDQLKRNYLLNLLNHTCGNIPRSCELAGVSRGHLYALMKKYNIVP